jgi:hypothetical protein
LNQGDFELDYQGSTGSSAASLELRHQSTNGQQNTLEEKFAEGVKTRI